jgi:hypothetical protein
MTCWKISYLYPCIVDVLNELNFHGFGDFFAMYSRPPSSPNEMDGLPTVFVDVGF